MSGRPLLDRRGCLTEAGLLALAASPPGRGPAEVVAHLGHCGRCQEAVLSRASGRPADAPRARKEPPPLWRTILVIVAVLLMVMTALVTLRQLRP